MKQSLVLQNRITEHSNHPLALLVGFYLNLFFLFRIYVFSGPFFDNIMTQAFQ